MKLIKLIPQFWAGDLPELVKKELRAWQDDLCFHGDGGCVFEIRGPDYAKLPLFLKWLSENGIHLNPEAEEDYTLAMIGT